jgi:hypothetical protein
MKGIGLFTATAISVSLMASLSIAAPTSVTIAGSFQTEVGCAGDWNPACAATHLISDSNDIAWQGTFSIPAGDYEYKAALNDSWDENYGLNATPSGANIPLSLPSETSVKFYYDDNTHWVTDNVNSVIATVPGSFQSELGCSGDWDPSCLRSWLQDPDGNGIYNFSTAGLPAGSYEAKVAIGESWDENYGLGGVQNGPNIPFTVPADGTMMNFSYDSSTHILTISSGAPAPVPDFDGDTKTDIALYRTSTGAWFYIPSSTNTPSGVGFGGDPSDIPVPGDYDGDGKTDYGIYRLSTGAWFIYPSKTWVAYGVGFGGDASDKPVPGDYDGDGITDLAIYRTSTGAWFIYPSSTGASGIYGVGFGGDELDKPVPADYDGDGKTDIAIYRSSAGAWFIYPSGTGPSGIYGVGFGGDTTDKPVPGDYDGDRKTDLGIYRADIGAWFIYPSSTGSSGIYGVGFGGDISDLPVIANPGSYM